MPGRARTYTAIAAAFALGGCAFSIDATPQISQQGELPVVDHTQPMPRCGQGWRRSPDGLLECSRPFSLRLN